MKSSRRRKLIAIIAAFCVAFTSLPMLTGSIDVQAASGKVKINTKTVTAKVAKKKAKKAKTIYLGAKVRKIKPGAFKSCKKAKTLVVQTKKLKKSSVKGSLKASKIKAIKVNVGSPAENKKYAKKYKAFFTKKNAGKAIKVSVMKTATASSGEAAASSQAGSSSGSTPSGTTPSGTDPGTGGQTTPTDPGTGAETKTITDYLGVTRTVSRNSSSEPFIDWNEPVVCDPIQRYDRTVDGEFTIDGGTVMKQVGGVTFVKDEIEGKLTNADFGEFGLIAKHFYFDFYNGDPNKLEVEILNDVQTVKRLNRAQTEATDATFVMSNDGYRLIRYLGAEEVDYQGLCQLKTTNLRTKLYSFMNLNGNLDCCGFVNDPINMVVKYDGKEIGRFSWKPIEKPVNGMHPRRKVCMDIINAALKDGSTSYAEDVQKITSYIYNNYKYGEDAGEQVMMTCVGGYLVIETYSVYYNKYMPKTYGFQSYGSYGNPNTNPDHVAFHWESNPSKYYEAQGHY